MAVSKTLLAEYPSSSTPGKSYKVYREDETGRVVCPEGCRGWLNKRPGKTRECTHTKKTVAALAAKGWRSQVRDEEVFIYAEGGAALPEPVALSEPEPVAAPTAEAPSLEAMRAAMRKRAGV